MSFDTALQIAHDALAHMHENGVELRASAAALERLVATPTDESHGTDATYESHASPHSHLSGKGARLAELRPLVLACTKCPHLVASRTQVVFGVGDRKSVV